MKVTFSYFAQIRQAAGTESETLEVSEGATILEALKRVDHGEAFESLVFDASGALRSTIPLFLNEVMTAPDTPLNHGDHVLLLSAMAGG